MKKNNTYENPHIYLEKEEDLINNKVDNIIVDIEKNLANKKNMRFERKTDYYFYGILIRAYPTVEFFGRALSLKKIKNLIFKVNIYLLTEKNSKGVNFDYVYRYEIEFLDKEDTYQYSSKERTLLVLQSQLINQNMSLEVTNQIYDSLELWADKELENLKKEVDKSYLKSIKTFTKSLN